MHVLPRVRELEERFPDTLSVIGVHAGKFSTERHTDRIADACSRLDVHHAVVNDRQFRVWREYGVTAWPTIALIDPSGYLVGIQPGEFPVDPIAETIAKIIHTAEKNGTLQRGPDPAAAAPTAPSSKLWFPTRAIVNGSALWVSDTGNARVLECDFDATAGAATVRRVHDDFVEPRGLVEMDGAVYTADRRGQAVYRLHSNGDAERVAGTGALADYRLEGDGSHVALRSPWGLGVLGERLVIAMAGSHQLWTLDPVQQRLELLAGRGGEDIGDGPAEGSLLAQPTGLARLGDGIAFADCETSAVRTYAAGSVRTVVGTGLFDFGDRDGEGDEVLLQHCEDVAVTSAGVAVADTYNDRIRRVDPLTRRADGWPGDAGVAGFLREPGGVTALDDGLLVSDTGHHRLVIVRGDGETQEVTFA